MDINKCRDDDARKFDAVRAGLSSAASLMYPLAGSEGIDSGICRIVDAYRTLDAVRLETGTASVWSVTRLKRRTKAFLDSVTQSGQVVVDAKSTTREQVVAITSSDFRLLVDAVLCLVGPSYATGAEMYRDVVHDGPPSSVAMTERQTVTQPRRALPTRSAVPASEPT